MGVTVPLQPAGTVQLYAPAALLLPQLPPLVAARPTPLSAAPPSVTVPLMLKLGVALLDFPARSQVARPPCSVKAMPVTLRASSPTSAAGTSSRTHCPVAGNGPMKRRLAVPSVPQAMMLAPQYARWFQLPSFHCSITSLGGLAGSRYTYVNSTSPTATFSGAVAL